jgi:uncharacterized membrane protein YgdD (TMEM256/DUF423 family)
MYNGKIKDFHFIKWSLVCASFGMALYVVASAMESHVFHESGEQIQRSFASGNRMLAMGCFSVIVMVLIARQWAISLRYALYLQWFGIIFFSINLMVISYLKTVGISPLFFPKLTQVGGFSLILSWLLCSFSIMAKLTSKTP